MSFFFNCDNQGSHRKETINLSPIVLIYNNTSIKDSLLIISDYMGSPMVVYKPVISYTSYENPFEEKTIISNSKDLKDTFKINAYSAIVLKHKYNLEDLYFLVNPGDTLYYSTYNGVPIYKSTNKKKNLFDFKSEALLRKDYDEFTSNDFYFNQIKVVILENKNEKKFYNDYLESRIAGFKKKNLLLDSLIKGKKISSEGYGLYKDKIKYDSINLLFNKFLFPNKEIKSLETFLKKDDSLLIYGFYKNYLHNLAEKKFKISTKNSGQSVFLDAEQAYDSIINSNHLFTQKTKLYLLYYYLNQIVENNSFEISKKYIDSFFEENPNESLKTFIRNKYLVDFYKYKEEIDSVFLIDGLKKKLRLKDFISKNKGKVIFIDFWASWCAPCREVMLDSKKLIFEYKNKNVVFLYISIDKSFGNWQKAFEEEDLLTYDYNLLAVNYPNAKFYKKINLQNIPRYLIFDKNGELVHKNAPSPNSIELRKEIDKYLLE